MGAKIWSFDLGLNLTTLHLGVIDLPYADASYKSVKRRKPKTSSSGSKTTGDVATILESKYGIMSFFYEKYETQIMTKLEESFAGAARSMALGAGVTMDPSAGAATEIEAMFRDFLANKEMDGQVAGVATQASLDGVSHRFAQPYKKRRPRPSFIDTGLYEGSFKVWVD